MAAPRDLNQFWARKKGIIARRKRTLLSLTFRQRKVAEEIQDRYGLPDLEQVARYLDWYMAFKSGWIDAATFEDETGLNAPEEK